MGSRASMARLLAEDLFLLCWDTDKGTVRSGCGDKLPAGIGGALVLDALRADALSVAGGRVTAAEASPADPLLAEVVAEASRRRRDPTVKALVQRVGTSRRQQQVRDRLVEAGVLRRERHRLLGLIPTTRYPGVAAKDLDEARGIVRSLLLGHAEPDDVGTHHVLLAALAGPTGAVDLLVERSQRKQARGRAASFSQHGVPDAVKQVVQDTQAAVIAAIAVSASQSSSNSS